MYAKVVDFTYLRITSQLTIRSERKCILYVVVVVEGKVVDHGDFIADKKICFYLLNFNNPIHSTIINI